MRQIVRTLGRKLRVSRDEFSTYKSPSISRWMYIDLMNRRRFSLSFRPSATQEGYEHGWHLETAYNVSPQDFLLLVGWVDGLGT